MSTTASTNTHQTLSTRRTSSNRPSGKRLRGRSEKGSGGGGGVCTCVQSFERAAERAEKKERERKGPKSWFERKFAIGIVLGLFGWSNYVFWGVILRRSWEGAEDALVGFVPGVVLSIFYGFFTLMFLLTYLKIILSSPGFAKDYVKPSEPPLAPEPPPLVYNYAYDPVISSSHLPYNDIYDGRNNDGVSGGGEGGTSDGHIVYPPSRKAPTSEYHDGEGDDRITHGSISLEDHGEFTAADEGDGVHNVIHSNTWLHATMTEGDASETLSVPYEMMPSRPVQAHTRSRSASITPLPPSTPSHQKSYSTPSTTYPPNKLVQGGSTGGGGGGSRGHGPAIRLPSLTAQTQTRVKPPMSPTSRSPTTPTPMAMGKGTGTGFQFDSSSMSYNPDPPRPSQPRARLDSQPWTRSDSQPRARLDSQPRARADSQPRTRADSHPLNTNTSPFDESPTTPTADRRTPTPGLTPSTHSHSHSHSKHISPFDSHHPLNTLHPPLPTTYQQHSRPTPQPSLRTPYQPERPIPYLDDLPPIAPGTQNDRSTSRWDRKPSDKPVLEPYYRYCSRDGIVKPPRCHHCRICNTCVLGYDHHCPWVGGCVGAQNRKFFVVFLFWSTLYLTYTLPLLIATLISRTNPSHPITFSTTSLDPNIIALLIVTVLFLAFSAGMLGTHIHLLRRNASTVEWHGVQEMKEREKAVVSQLVPVCECLGMGRGEKGNGGLLGWKDEEVGGGAGGAGAKGVSSKGFKGRVELRKKWDDEWGRIGKEGNLWWLGASRVNWEAVMGKNPWTWFLPIGNMTAVGVEYQRNPRFDEQGRWMKRENWPEELR